MFVESSQLNVERSPAPNTLRTIQLSSYPTIQLSNYPTIQLSNYPTIQLSNYPTIQLVRVVVPRLALLRRAAELVVLTLRTPRVGIESGGARIRFDFPVRAERRVAVLGGLLPSA